MIFPTNLAAELAHRYDTSPADTLTAVETYTGQINDDPALYDRDRGELTQLGADVVRVQYADWYTTDRLVELEQARQEREALA